jgi:beta-lactamase superfamily II metal-dependent hydrolase
MATRKPKDLRVRTYDVGFGDCFLLTFRYPTGSPREKHVLIDFGSTAAAKKGIPLSGVIADDIASVTGNRLDAIVVSHRHEDHISGFATGGGKSPGDVIRKIAKNALILQPWTEDPKVPPKATSPAGTSLRRKGLQSAFVTSLARMHEVAESVVAQARRLRPAEMEATPGAGDGRAEAAGGATPANPDDQPAKPPTGLASIGGVEAVGKRLQALLTFLGETNLKNASAVKNLIAMSTPKRHRYLSYGDRSGLETVLPGVKVDVLGPPTIKDYKEVLKQRDTDPEEFWHLQAAAARLAARPGRGVLFPGVPRSDRDQIPQNARWFVRRLRGIQAQQLLELVRIVDNFMNNTSLILLFTVGSKRLLFSGDAQIENWEYALKVADEKKQNVKDLADVNVYKVGHHGSLNATPKTLWNGFKKKGKGLETLLSTRRGKHGSTDSGTEVPRKVLETALEKQSKLHSTLKLPGTKKKFFEDVLVDFG